MPARIQLSRKKGWRMPPNTVKVDRSTRWGNPYKLAEYPSVMTDAERRAHSVDCFRRLLLDEIPHPRVMIGFTAEDVRRELRGKNLACWCALPKPGEPDVCHAAVLLELANARAPR